MSNEHPITPPPELFRQWEGMPSSLAFEAAYRAGADTELEACCEWLRTNIGTSFSSSIERELRVIRRPKPPSLKEQSIALINKIQANKEMWQIEELDIIRQALELLPDEAV